MIGFLVLVLPVVGLNPDVLLNSSYLPCLSLPLPLSEPFSFDTRDYTSWSSSKYFEHLCPIIQAEQHLGKCLFSFSVDIIITLPSLINNLHLF